MTGAVGALIMVVAGLLGILGMFIIGPILLVIALVGYLNRKPWTKKVALSAVLVIVVPFGISSAMYVGRSVVSSVETGDAPILSRTQSPKHASSKAELDGSAQRKSFDDLERMIDALPRK